MRFARRLARARKKSQAHCIRWIPQKLANRWQPKGYATIYPLTAPYATTTPLTRPLDATTPPLTTPLRASVTKITAPIIPAEPHEKVRRRHQKASPNGILPRRTQARLDQIPICTQAECTLVHLTQAESFACPGARLWRFRRGSCIGIVMIKVLSLIRH